MAQPFSSVWSAYLGRSRLDAAAAEVHRSVRHIYEGGAKIQALMRMLPFIPLGKNRPLVALEPEGWP